MHKTFISYHHANEQDLKNSRYIVFLIDSKHKDHDGRIFCNINDARNFVNRCLDGIYASKAVIGFFVFDQLAESITTLSTTGSFVVGLFGEWGSGKTSVINLTEKAVKQSLCDKDKRNIRVIRFNPWGYVDGSQLMGQFFSALSSEFQYDKKVLFQASLGEAIEDYAFALEFSKYLPKVGLLLRPFLPAIRNFTERAGKAIQDKANSKKYDVLRLKKCVEDILKKKKIKLI